MLSQEISVGKKPASEIFNEKLKKVQTVKTTMEAVTTVDDDMRNSTKFNYSIICLL